MTSQEFYLKLREQKKIIETLRKENGALRVEIMKLKKKKPKTGNK